MQNLDNRIGKILDAARKVFAAEAELAELVGGTIHAPAPAVEAMPETVKPPKARRKVEKASKPAKASEGASCPKCEGKTGRGVRHGKYCPEYVAPVRGKKPNPTAVLDEEGKDRSTCCDALAIQRGTPPDCYWECSKCGEEVIK